MQIKQAALTAAILVASGQAFAAATIFNDPGGAGSASVALGVNDLGHLNTDVGGVAVNAGPFLTGSTTGLAYKFPDGAFRDATSPGCFCEGWGVSFSDSDSGFANEAIGTAGLVLDSFASTVTTATSIVHLASVPGISVTHAYAPATVRGDVFFKSHVTITNTTGAAVSDLRYVRVMDWDVPPTEFDEFVTIAGTATTTLLERSHNNGFNTADPLGGDVSLDASTEDTDFADFFSLANDGDHGAYFRFNFGTLEDLMSYSFDIFYGAAEDEATALAAIGDELIELFSLGQSDSGGSAANDSPTFIFGFTGVGGDPVIPPPGVPEPASLLLVGTALAGLAASRRRKVLA